MAKRAFALALWKMRYKKLRFGLPDLGGALLPFNARLEPIRQITLGEFLEAFQSNRPPGKVGNTSYTEDIHIAHLLQIMGKRAALLDIPDRLQSYVTERATEKGRRGEPISHTTIKKEVATLRSIWNR